jgi:hypothetical protein
MPSELTRPDPGENSFRFCADSIRIAGPAAASRYASVATERDSLMSSGARKWVQHTTGAAVATTPQHDRFSLETAC